MTPPYTLDQARAMPLFDRSVSLLCWAYNEEEIIGDYLVRANALMAESVADYEIIVIDDCSTDRTNAIVRSLQPAIPQITLIRNPVNLNVGRSSQKAIMSATKEFLFWQTIDWAYDIAMLRTHLELLKSYDVVAGVRREPVKVVDHLILARPILGVLRIFHVNHITKRSDTIPKALVSVLNYLLVRLLFRLPLSDYQNVVYYPTRRVQSILFESRSSFSNPEGLLKCYWTGASIIEVPISFIPRKAGLAKGTTTKAITNSVLDIFRLWFRWIIRGQRVVTRMGSVTRLNPEQWARR